VGYYKNSKNSNERKLIEADHTIIILKKGQPFADNEELTKTFYLDREHKDFAKVNRIRFRKYLGHYLMIYEFGLLIFNILTLYILYRLDKA
jgi:hypothetical protein